MKKRNECDSNEEFYRELFNSDDHEPPKTVNEVLIELKIDNLKNLIMKLEAELNYYKGKCSRLESLLDGAIA